MPSRTQPNRPPDSAGGGDPPRLNYDKLLALVELGRLAIDALCHGRYDDVIGLEDDASGLDAVLRHLPGYRRD